MATQKGSGGLVSRAVREALSTLVSPQICEQLISRSLASQGLSAVPESGTEIGEWLEGPLRSEVETTVGADAADLMMMQLGPIAAYAAIAQSPRSAPSQPSATNERSDAPTDYPPKPARHASDPLDSRPTDLRFDVSAEPVWSPATEPPAKLPSSPTRAKSSAPQRSAFRSDPPTGVYPAPGEALPASAFRSQHPPSGRAADKPLPSPAKRVSPVPSAPIMRGRTTRPAAGDESGSESSHQGLPVVFTATNNEASLRELRRYLASSAVVTHVPDLVGLLDALDEPPVSEPIVLIDCQSPTVHISSVAAIGEDLPRGTTVVLWGVDENTWQQLNRERSPACRWVRCSSEATTEDVGSLCSMLLG